VNLQVRPLLFGIVSLLIAGSALGADNSKKTVGRLFEQAAVTIARRTAVAVYVPVSLQSLDTYAQDGCSFADANADRYEVAVYGRLTEYGQTEPLPCEANQAGLLGIIIGTVQPIPDLSKDPKARRLSLGNGAVAWFLPVSCGGSCAPASLYWQTTKASYVLQMKLASSVAETEQREQLLRTANSLRLIGK